LGDVPTLEEVLNSSRPVNKFVGPAPAFEAVFAGLVDAVAAQRVVGGSLGAYQQRSYPSGGARHPFEAYLVSKGIDGLPLGAYWFDPVTHELHQRDSEVAPESIDSSCFGKGGVVSAKVCLAITCRWLRHSWKYRYARSYRMLLLELGHMIQAINLSMRARGVDVYQCPSIHDENWLAMLDIDDDGREGPMYVLGLGLDGRL
jgi:SagB-type dehydrogenase family enzyme